MGLVSWRRTLLIVNSLGKHLPTLSPHPHPKEGLEYPFFGDLVPNTEAVAKVLNSDHHCAAAASLQIFHRVVIILQINRYLDLIIFLPVVIS